MNKILWLVLDTIREICYKRDHCEGCPCAEMQMSMSGKRYYCTIADVPYKWQTDIIRYNLEEREDAEE